MIKDKLPEVHLDFREFFYCLAHAPSSISNLRPTAKSWATPASYDKHRYASASPSLYSQSKRFSAFQRPDISVQPTHKEHCSIFLTIAHYIKWLRRETIWSEGEPSTKTSPSREHRTKEEEKRHCSFRQRCSMPGISEPSSPKEIHRQ